jgi:hypothetical protein
MDIEQYFCGTEGSTACEVHFIRNPHPNTNIVKRNEMGRINVSSKVCKMPYPNILFSSQLGVSEKKATAID